MTVDNANNPTLKAMGRDEKTVCPSSSGRMEVTKSTQGDVRGLACAMTA